jgi:UDP-glucose 4-epimerase
VNILVTGGAGYIGSHTCVELLQAGYGLVVVDNLSNSKEEALERVKQLTGKGLVFYRVDLRDRAGLDEVLKQHEFVACVHFAGLKSVGESVSQPLRFYENNVYGTLVLCEALAKYGVMNLVFSSSATVYGEPAEIPLREATPLNPPLNPYGRTKLVIENLLRDLHRANPAWNVALLRYFNPVGAHPSAQIGEDPRGIPNNLFPYLTQVAIGRLPELRVFGDDYSTPDGTGIRDYIHVVDLALGHLKALEKLEAKPGVVTYNLGTGRGYSVLEVVAAFGKACGKQIPYKIVARRPGDAAVSYSDATLAQRELGWQAQRGLEEMCADAWRWQKNNPQGY